MLAEYPNIGNKGVKKFKELGPLTIEEILEKSKIDHISFDERVYCYKEKMEKESECKLQGQFNRHTGQFEGIVRRTSMFDEVWDCVRVSGMTHGFVRSLDSEGKWETQHYR